MASPVTVSRIQNRRGTQVDFNGLIFTPGGPNSLYPLPTIPFPGGTGYYPGNPSADPDFTVTNYPNVLMPGELALCTDTFTVYIGNINGGYVQLTNPPPPTISDLVFGPLVVISLPPSPGIFTPIPALNYLATPFFTLLYDITDSPSPDWNTVGTNFSRNGEMKITAVISPGVVLTDTSTEVNNTLHDISFTAAYSGPNIQISYMHNFPGSLTFSSSTIRWLPI